MNEFLWEFAQKFPSENKFQIVLKSALSVAAAQNADVGKTNDKWMCRKCKTLWMHGCFKAEEIQPTKRYDELLEKHEDNAGKTRKQQKYFNYMQSRQRTSAKYTCNLCSYKTRIPVGKDNPLASSARSVSKPTTAPVPANQSTNPKKSKKNRKQKRDPTAGLIIPAAAAKNKGPPKKPEPFSSNHKLSALVSMLKKKEQQSSSQSQSKDRLKLLLK